PVTVPALAQPPADHSLVDRALAFVSRERANLGFGATDVSEFAPDPVVQRTSAGAATVHLHQRYRRLPVFQMSLSVRFHPQCQGVDAIGDSAPIPAGINVAPRLNVVEAVLRAAQHLAATGGGEAVTDRFGQTYTAPTIDITGYRPTVESAFPLPSQPTML